MVEPLHDPRADLPWIVRNGHRVRRVVGSTLLAVPVFVYLTGLPQTDAGACGLLIIMGVLLASLIGVSVVEHRLSAKREGEPPSRERMA